MSTGTAQAGGWRDVAACAGHPTEWWFPDPSKDLSPEARAICESCPVIAECAEAGRHEEGWWGLVRPKPPRQARMVACDVCGREFETLAAKRCPACKANAARTWCARCGSETTHIPGRREFCSDECRWPEPEHGTTARYERGCTCEDCRYAEWRARKARAIRRRAS